MTRNGQDTASPVLHEIIEGKLACQISQTHSTARRSVLLHSSDESAGVSKQACLALIFVVFRGLRSKAFIFVDRMPLRHFRRCRQNPLFSVGAKTPFDKNPVLVLPNKLAAPSPRKTVNSEDFALILYSYSLGGFKKALRGGGFL